MISEEYLGYLFNSIVYLEVLAAIVATIYVKKYSDSRLKYFFLYLWLIAGTEIAGTLMFYKGLDNVLLYNVSKVIQYNFVLCLFFSYLRMTPFRTMLKILIVIFNLSIVLNMVNGDGPLTEQPSYAFTLGSLIISIAVFMFFYEAVRTEIVLNMNKFLIVWIGVGLLMFHLVNLPLFAFANSMVAISPNSNSLLLIKWGTNVFMYGTFIIGYLWSREKYNI